MSRIFSLLIISISLAVTACSQDAGSPPEVNVLKDTRSAPAVNTSQVAGSEPEVDTPQGAFKESTAATSEDILVASQSSKPCAPSNHAALPPMYQLEYPKAREQLLASGWQPLETHSFVAISEENGHTQEKWESYKEVEGCSLTGSASCTFKFNDAYGNTLEVVAAGEVLPQVVNSFRFTCS